LDGIISEYVLENSFATLIKVGAERKKPAQLVLLLTIIITRGGFAGGGDGQFNHSRGIAVDSTNNVYVVPSGNH